jgi:peptidyl-prolyl cis-trans isomerase SurA
MESRGLVINDYQAELEKEWVKKLKEKYPVRINQAALKSLQK